MKKAEQSINLPTVDPKHLEAAYLDCAKLFNDIHPDGSVSAESILDKINETQTPTHDSDTLDLFRRLCLLVQLVADIDANWSEYGFAGTRPDTLPSLLFELASSEIAFESTNGQYASTFFLRDILDDAIALFRPN
jgi:hypothetical protein